MATDKDEGWEGLEEQTGGLAPDSVEALWGVRDLEPVYPLLHSLVGSSARDFLIRAAAMESLVAAEAGSFTSDDLGECLYWLTAERRDSVVRALRRSGWLEWTPAGGTTITPAGRWAYDILSFLHKRLRESEILPTLAGIEYALDIGLDPIRHLRSMRSRLVSLSEQVAAARDSHSEVVLRGSAARLGEVLDLSRQVRAVLDRVPMENSASREVARDIHDLLSRLHGLGAELQSAIAEVGRQFLKLTAGLTVEQIVRALMTTDLADLAEAGRTALLPVPRAPPLLNTPALAWAAERQFARVREEPVPVEWTEPEEAPRLADAPEVPPEVSTLLRDLVDLEREGVPAPLSRVVPREGAAVSFLRASLLALVGRGGAGEGVAGRLGALRLRVTGEGDGWPEELDPGPLLRLTPGEVGPDRPAGSEEPGR